jgi:DNA invertase Pin-like site-specific DNA recombinase
MKAQYVRVSHSDQNTSRQVEFGATVYEDKISGTVPFKERPLGKRLWDDICTKKVTEVIVHSIDRLGRNSLDILNTINDITAQGCNLTARKEGFSYLDDDGKVNIYAKVLVGVLSTLSEMEYSIRKESQREGIQLAKERNAYKGNGRKVGTVLTSEDFLSKKSSVKVMKYIKQGFSLRVAAVQCSVSLGTVQKVIKLCKESDIDLSVRKK